MPRKTKTDEFNQHDRRHEKSAALVKVDDPIIANDDREILLSHQMLGAARYAGQIHGQTKSDMVQFLRIVRDERRFLHYGFTSHDQFLGSQYSPMSRSTFHREEFLLLKEGEVQYDLFNEWKLPAKLRHQLSSGDVTIDGDEAVVGDQRISLNDGGVGVKKLVERLVKDKIAAEKANAELVGYQDKFNKLKAAVDEANEEPDYVTAFIALTKAFMTYNSEVGYLPSEMRDIRRGDLDQLRVLFDQATAEFDVDPDESAMVATSDAIDGENF